MTLDRAIVFTPDLGDNSLGRTYVTWLLLRELGWQVDIVDVARRERAVWAPLQGTEFAQDCRSEVFQARSERDALVERLIGESALVVCTKGVSGSFGMIAPSLHRLSRRFVMDYDDPDLDLYLPSGDPSLRLLLRYGRHPKPAAIGMYCYSWFRRLRSNMDLVVSNPVLQSMHGGTVIPHVRLDEGPGAAHVSTRPTVAFVGSPRPHKGVDVLREAAAEVGLPLVVTGQAPTDASINETWLGQVPYSEAMALLRAADVIALPSDSNIYSQAQLPAKLMDGMLAARLVVASDLRPVTWALGGAGLTFDAGSRTALVKALETARDPGVRTRLGEAARDRAVATFTVKAALPTARAVYGEPASRVVPEWSARRSPRFGDVVWPRPVG